MTDVDELAAYWPDMTGVPDGVDVYGQYPVTGGGSDVGEYELILGDCLEILPTLTGINAVISDPPYGINYSPRQNSSKAWGKKTFTGNTVVAHDDKPFDPTSWLSFPTVVLFGANHFADKLPPTRGWIVWDKREYLPSNDFADCELIWTNVDSVARIYRHYWNGALRASEHGEPRVHPTQKPLTLMKWIVERYTKPGDTVLDPYCGSGTTGVACLQTGRRFIGVEISPEYYQIAQRRLRDAAAQPLLLTL